MTENMITIGKITKNQGNKGEVRVLPLTDFPDRFELLNSVYLVKDDITMEKEIDNLRFHKNFVILKLTDVNNIEEALELRDFEVQIPDAELIPLEENEYYIDDLIDFTVLTSDGQKIGKVEEVVTTGGTDIFLVKGNDKDYMIPAALEIIIEIDEENYKMVVEPIPGLLEL
ncbi:MAG: ribosome maturation factor RimM [Bacillota bacterium]